MPLPCCRNPYIKLRSLLTYCHIIVIAHEYQASKMNYVLYTTLTLLCIYVYTCTTDNALYSHMPAIIIIIIPVYIPLMPAIIIIVITCIYTTNLLLVLCNPRGTNQCDLPFLIPMFAQRWMKWASPLDPTVAHMINLDICHAFFGRFQLRGALLLLLIVRLGCRDFDDAQDMLYLFTILPPSPIYHIPVLPGASA